MWTKIVAIEKQINTLPEAQEVAAGLKLQDGVWGVEIVENSGYTKRAYSVFGYMDLPEGVTQEALPAGMNVRFAPPQMMTRRAEWLGALGFAKGLKAPAQDKEFMGMLEAQNSAGNQQFGWSMPWLDAWLRGWAQAHNESTKVAV